MIDGTMNSWFEAVDVHRLRKSINNRRVYIWGAYICGKQVRDFLEQNKILVDGYMDSKREELYYDNRAMVKPASILNDKDIFIFIAIKGKRTPIIELLEEFNKKENSDYVYISNILPEITISACNASYTDNYGNSIILKDDLTGCKITFIGSNNKIEVGKNFNCKGSLNIILQNASTVRLGDYLTTDGDVQIEARDSAKLFIGEGFSVMGNSAVKALRGGELSIGDYVTTGERFLCSCGRYTPLSIGGDCMFSHDVVILSTSSHSILDLKSKKSISLENEKYIKVGSHVWLGKGVSVLYNSDIGNGCIVGAGSVVKNTFSNNCIIAGNIAKVIREGCTWDRRAEIEFEDLI